MAKIEALQARSRGAREALEAIKPLLETFRQSVLAAAFRGDLTADWPPEHPSPEPKKELEEVKKQVTQKKSELSEGYEIVAEAIQDLWPS